jgi:hypothetical protein
MSDLNLLYCKDGNPRYLDRSLFGITIDEKLKFQIHINNQTKKANQRLGMIKRSFTYILLLVDFMLVASGGVLIFRKDLIAIYLIYIVNNSKRFYHVRS